MVMCQCRGVIPGGAGGGGGGGGLLANNTFWGFITYH